MPYGSVDRALAQRFAEADAWARRRKYPLYREVPSRSADPDRARTPTDSLLGGFVTSTPSKESPLLLETRLGGRSIPVKVFEYSPDGQDAAFWPAITYRFQSERFRNEEYHPIDPLWSTHRDIGYTTDATTGEVKQGPNTALALDHPDPVSLYYEIKVWALSKEEGYALLKLCKTVLPARTYLRVRLADGSSVTYDVMRTQGFSWAGGLDPTLPEGDPGERFFSWAATYEIEAYDDNTLEVGDTGDASDIHPTILQRYVTIEPRDTEDDPAPDGVPFETPGS